MDEAPYITYILACRDGTLYTGWTSDIKKRLAAHNAGRGAKYTRGRLPAALAYAEGFESQSQAMKRENAIKKMSRAEKLALMDASKVKAIEAGGMDMNDFPEL
jgi:putative endonuclease